MATATRNRSTGPAGRQRPTTRKPDTRRRSYRWLWAAAAALGVIAALFAIFRSSTPAVGPVTGGRSSAYQIGSPGIGQQAPPFTLPASTGGTIDLQELRGKTTLLYFQEGVGCQPCWTQMKDLEKAAPAVQAAGIDRIVSITTQPVGLLAQKAKDEGISTPVLADTDLAVSQAYEANKFGMMGDSMDGHSFVLVGPDGTIQWRADYGGAPKYTMYVPVQQLLADLAAGRRP